MTANERAEKAKATRVGFAVSWDSFTDNLGGNAADLSYGATIGLG
jgi:hypothetical protein